MVEMARGLGMRTTAEFVESAAALDLISSMGVEMAQGYHIARPGPAGFMIDTTEAAGLLLVSNGDLLALTPDLR
jgi:EAL domain-containing protein (putative c-di-GMP-specific phosphodiesterase class I)